MSMKQISDLKYRVYPAMVYYLNVVFQYLQIKDNMITHMASVNVTDIKKLIQVSSVVAGAKEDRTELSEQSKVYNKRSKLFIA